ncbi:hypothetical protein GALMADRAFT_237741 [Galerina marginata CBS 339.88]|uniref:DUF676 domain-containing protein n=1 Tax=Galerina marginata (strain CBS 339.88) TaxID=685588 RepID=A0A067TRB6_GALM3|nr:hypothetical protein GALMADRAFT_237741 [Galerina marginata CBS 339.88]
MSSVYFPAHVVLFFRRIVNVVSTLSISNQYVFHQQAKTDDAPRHISWSGLKDFGSNPSRSSLEYLRSVEWPRWTHRNNRDSGFLVSDVLSKANGASRNHLHPEAVLKATLNFPNWIPDNWSWPSTLFSYQPELNLPQHNEEPPPTKPPKRPDPKRQEEKHWKPPRKDPPSSNQKHEGATAAPPDTIHQLLINPALFDPVRTPRFPIVLCHGLYGFDSRGPASFPSMRMHYWSNVLNILRGTVGAEVIVTSVPGTGFITSRADGLDEQLRLRARGRGINFLAHSMGGLDCRHLISHIQPREYVPLSLTSISTPHRGSPFMDWCADNIGLGKLRQQEQEMMDLLKRRTQRDIEDFSSDIADEEAYAKPDAQSPSKSKSNSKPKSSTESSFSLSLSSLPSSFVTLLLSIVDSPAYANLTSSFLNDVFNPATPDDPSVKYWSVAGRMSAESVSVWHPFWLPKMVLDGAEEKEREKLKKVWEEEEDKGGNRGGGWGKEIPFWADERQWGNDGLVTVQSAQWGEFLGIMEGCDHWEMRGARGIEFGVDLPAIPAIGLGSLPLPSSLYNRRSGRVDPTQPQAQAQGDGWGFGDWTRFVGAWKKSKVDAEKAEAEAATTLKQDGNKRDPMSDDVGASGKPQERESISTLSSSSSSPSVRPLARETENQKLNREQEQRVDDQIVKSSTDTMSAVFDWLIERVPAPILGSSKAVDGSSNGGKASAATVKPVPLPGAGSGDKALGAAAVAYTVGPGSSSSSSQGQAQTPPSEMKRRMEREDKGRRKNKELASKDDLERFYIALTRKMYDEGL